MNTHVQTEPTTWTCARCGLIMLALSRDLHEALHEHVQPTVPRPPDPRIDEILSRLAEELARLARLEAIGGC